jgi:hypothetical protein
MTLMGGLLWLASQGHVWAQDLVVAAGPLLILIAGILAVMIVTDHDAVAGKSGIVAGVAILVMARFGIVPEATVLTLGPWALIVMGMVIALAGLGRHARSGPAWLVGAGVAARPDADSLDAAREYEPRLNSPLKNGTSGRQRAKAS